MTFSTGEPRSTTLAEFPIGTAISGLTACCEQDRPVDPRRTRRRGAPHQKGRPSAGYAFWPIGRCRIGQWETISGNGESRRLPAFMPSWHESRPRSHYVRRHPQCRGWQPTRLWRSWLAFESPAGIIVPGRPAWSRGGRRGWRLCDRPYMASPRFAIHLLHDVSSQVGFSRNI
jgi:hypothetical protein